MARNLDDARAKLCGFRKLSSITGRMKIAPKVDCFDSPSQKPLHRRSIVFNQQRIKERHVARRERVEERRRNVTETIEEEQIIATTLLHDLRDILRKRKPFRNPADSNIHIVAIEMLGVG